MSIELGQFIPEQSRGEWLRTSEIQYGDHSIEDPCELEDLMTINDDLRGTVEGLKSPSIRAILLEIARGFPQIRAQRKAFRALQDFIRRGGNSNEPRAVFSTGIFDPKQHGIDTILRIRAYYAYCETLKPISSNSMTNVDGSYSASGFGVIKEHPLGQNTIFWFVTSEREVLQSIGTESSIVTFIRRLPVIVGGWRHNKYNQSSPVPVQIDDFVLVDSIEIMQAGLKAKNKVPEKAAIKPRLSLAPNLGYT
ncbi:MAG: hypothetical protein Q8R11_01585 [bacterium]|nr:hypothetical protein [bacterium]